MSSALRDVLCACYESGGVDEATGSQLTPKLQVGHVDFSDSSSMVRRVTTVFMLPSPVVPKTCV